MFMICCLFTDPIPVCKNKADVADSQSDYRYTLNTQLAQNIAHVHTVLWAFRACVLHVTYIHAMVSAAISIIIWTDYQYVRN